MLCVPRGELSVFCNIVDFDIALESPSWPNSDVFWLCQNSHPEHICTGADCGWEKDLFRYKWSGSILPPPLIFIFNVHWYNTRPWFYVSWERWKSNVCKFRVWLSGIDLRSPPPYATPPSLCNEQEKTTLTEMRIKSVHRKYNVVYE